MEKLPVVNKVIVDKLKSVSQDMKTYINMNASISDGLPDDNVTFELFSPEELEEFIHIRNRIKALTRKLEYKC
jgi:hypothetical protein